MTDTSTPSVLLVEDDELLAMSLQDKLIEEGYEVTRVSSGEEGLAFAEQHHPTIIVSDITLPSMNGLQMVSKIHESEKGRKTPVVILTNNNDMSFIAEAVSKDASVYLLKSDHTLAGIVEAVREQIAKSY